MDHLTNFFNFLLNLFKFNSVNYYLTVYLDYRLSHQYLLSRQHLQYEFVKL